MSSLTAVIQSQAEKIIIGGRLSPDDIHNLSLTDKVSFQVITDPLRAQDLWGRHLPFPSVFLFDRAVHVYVHESDEKGAIFSYYVKSHDGHQVVCRRAVASGKPDVLIAEEVKLWYDLWISFFVGDRLKTPDDILFFQERHGKDLQDADYLKFAEDNKFEENNLPPYFEVAMVFKHVLESVNRFRTGTTLTDKRVDVVLNDTLIPLIKKGYLSLDYLYSILYLMGKNLMNPGVFFYLRSIFSNIGHFYNEAPDEESKRYMSDHIVQFAQSDYLLQLYKDAPGRTLLNDRFCFSEETQHREKAQEAVNAYSDLTELPGYSCERFNSSVLLDGANRSFSALLMQLKCFHQMVQNGYLTFERLTAEHQVSLGYPFLMSYCTPVFLGALSEKLLSFEVLESCFFRELPFFFHLESQGDVQVPKALLDFRDSFIEFLRILKKRNLQNDFDDFYAVPFFELFKKLVRSSYISPFECIDEYSQFEAGISEEEKVIPFFKAVKEGVFTVDFFVKIYTEFVHFIEQTLLKHMSASELGPETRDLIVKSRPHYALMIRLFLFNFMNRVDSSEAETLEDALMSFMKVFEAFCSKMITPTFVKIITDRHFVKEFQEFYKYYRLSNSFVKTRVALVDYSIEKRQKFDGILSSLDALEYMAYFAEAKQELSFDVLRDCIRGVQLFNRRVIELTSRYSFALPNNPILVNVDWDIDKQLAIYSVLSEEKSADIYVAITRQYYVLMASLFGDKTSLNLVNTMIKEGQALQMSAYIASGRITMDQYSDFILRVLKMSFLVRSRTYILTSCIELMIVSCMGLYVGELSKLIMEEKEVDLQEVDSLVARFSLNLIEDEAAEGE